MMEPPAAMPATLEALAHSLIGVGATETMPPNLHGLVPWSARLGVHRAPGRAETSERNDRTRDAARVCAA